MNAVTKTIGAVDRFQQRLPGLAFPVAVWKKFSDDRAGNLAALIAYYGFLSVFPLLLLFVTVLDMTLRGDPGLHQRLLDSALAQYPVIGEQIRSQFGTIPGTGTGLPMAVSIVLLVFGARGVAGAMRNALCEVWDVPRDRRPGFPLSLLWDLALTLTVGIGLVLTTTLSGLAGGAGHILTGAGASVGAVAVSLVLNVGVFWCAFRLAAARQVRWHDLRVGAAIAAVVWQALQFFGGYIVSHQLQRASTLYGYFGIVLGLVAWLYLQAEVTLYAAEVDVVLTRRLWPRALQPESREQEGQDEKEGQRHGRQAA